MLLRFAEENLCDGWYSTERAREREISCQFSFISSLRSAHTHNAYRYHSPPSLLSSLAPSLTKPNLHHFLVFLCVCAEVFFYICNFMFTASCYYFLPISKWLLCMQPLRTHTYWLIEGEHFGSSRWKTKLWIWQTSTRKKTERKHSHTPTPLSKPVLAASKCGNSTLFYFRGG